LGEGESPTLKPLTDAGSGTVQEKEKARLGEIIAKVNDLFGADTTEGDKLIYVNDVIKGNQLDLENPRAVQIDPVELKLTDRTYETVRLNGVFGALRDAGPDFWGRRVIEKYSGKPKLGELDYLLQSPDDRAGALGFGLNKVPPAPKREFNKTLDLKKL
jgi:hypothetical protein